MRRIGEDVAETLDYTPGHFTVERHIRDKWACDSCETLVQATAPAHIIDKGIPTAGLLVQVLVARYQDLCPLPAGRHLRSGRVGDPQSRWPSGWARAACICSRWSMRPRPALAHPCCHADAPGGDALDPGAGKTHRAYLWSYGVGAFDPIKAVVYDSADSRAGRHAQAFLGEWRNTLICDDYAEPRGR